MEEQRNDKLIRKIQSEKITGQYNLQADSYYIAQCILHLSGYEKKKYTIDQLYNTKCLSSILCKMCPEYFSMDCQNTEMENALVEYFYNEYGYFIKPLLKRQNRKQIIMTLVIYACIYSVAKQIFVEKIMKLPTEIQEKLVNSIEILQIQLKDMRNQNKLIQNITKLQNENAQLKSALNLLRQQKQQCQDNLYDLHQQLKSTTQQRNKFCLEKRKILTKFSLSNLAEYEDLCIKLVQENQIYCKRQEQLIQTIHNLEKQIKQLKDGLRISDQMIVALNATKNDFMKKYTELKKEITAYRQSIVHNQQKCTINDNNKFIETLTTQDQTLRKQTGIGLTCSGHQLFNSNNSCFSIGERRNSVRNIFIETKNSLLMQEKMQGYEQQLQTLKLKIVELEVEIDKLNDKERFFIKKSRKIKKISDQFIEQYEGMLQKQTIV